MSGSYIVYSENRDGMLHTPDMSRRARPGVAELVEDLQEKAAYFADGLRREGFEVPNEVCFNRETGDNTGLPDRCF